VSSQALAARRFKNLHEAPGTFIIPNPGDPGTARLLELAGFEALATSTAAVAFGLGVEDGKVERDRMLDHVREVCASTSLPVSADLGDGFGRDPATVAETIRLAAEAGTVGGSIEDATGDRDSPLFPRSLAVERIAAAAEAARALPFPFMLTARAENFVVGDHDLDDALGRLEAYREAGADVLYAPLLPDEEAVRLAVQVAGPCPLNVLALGQGVASDFERLEALGVRRISLGSGLARFALTAALAAIDQIRNKRFDFLRDAVSLSAMNQRFAAEQSRPAGNV